MPEAVAPSSRDGRRVYALYVLGVLFAIYVLAGIDRQVLAVMVDPIRNKFGLSDSQVGLLSGLAFSLVYATCGFPAARLADRYGRIRLIAWGLAVWSLFTGLFALARSYWQLFVCRMAVGLGEACLSPAAIPLLADYFAERHLGKAVAAYMLAVPVGNGLASMFGGHMFATFAPDHAFDLAVLGRVEPWQVLLLLLSALGFVLLLLFCTVREPPRSGERTAVAQDGMVNADSFAALGKFLRANAAVYLAIAAPLLASALMYFGVGYWIPSYFLRGGETGADLLFYWGALSAVGGAAGVLAGGLCADWLSVRFEDGMWRTLMLGTMLLGIGFTLFATVGNSAAALFVLAPGVFGNGILQAAGITTVMKVTPNRMRGQVSALYFLLVNLVGAGLGPTFVALLSDYVFTGESGLGLAMGTIAFLASACALLLLARSTHSYVQLRRSLREPA